MYQEEEEVRVDTALYTNYKVNPHYDSLVLKIISKGKDRNEVYINNEKSFR